MKSNIPKSVSQKCRKIPKSMLQDAAGHNFVTLRHAMPGYGEIQARVSISCICHSTNEEISIRLPSGSAT